MTGRFQVRIDPAGFGIARHLEAQAKIVAERTMAGAKLYLDIPWWRGDVSTERRAAFEARQKLLERCQRDYVLTRVQWQAPAMSLPHAIYALRLPAGLPGFDYGLPRVFLHEGELYFNPSPFRFSPADIVRLGYDYLPGERIDLIGFAQPLQFPANGHGLYFFTEAELKEGIEMQLSGLGSVTGLKLTILIGALGVRNRQLTGQEIMHTTTLLAPAIGDFGPILRQLPTNPQFLMDFPEYIRTNISRHSRNYTHFIQQLFIYVPLVYAAFVRGLESLEPQN